MAVPCALQCDLGFWSRLVRVCSVEGTLIRCISLASCQGLCQRLLGSC